MNFDIPDDIRQKVAAFREHLNGDLKKKLNAWFKEGSLPPVFFNELGKRGFVGYEIKDNAIRKKSGLLEALLIESLAEFMPGAAVAALSHMDLGVFGLFRYGSLSLHQTYGRAAVTGEKIMCLGNTENTAGSDVAGIQSVAERVDGGYLLNGSKSFVTNGHIADLALITAVTDPSSERSRRLSLFLVDLMDKGVKRNRLNKKVWIPSDLTRLTFKDVFIPEGNLLGSRGKGLSQVLDIFTHSRVSISALTMGSASGAFEKGIRHGMKRDIFGKKILSFQAKAFEAADLYAKMRGARLSIFEACEKMDRKEDFRKEASIAKYLSVNVAKEVTMWAADLFGAASVIYDHPIHKYPLDVWGSQLGEGTQDVQKLVIFRQMMADDFKMKPDI